MRTRRGLFWLSLGEVSLANFGWRGCVSEYWRLLNLEGGLAVRDRVARLLVRPTQVGWGPVAYIISGSECQQALTDSVVRSVVFNWNR